MKQYILSCNLSKDKRGRHGREFESRSLRGVLDTTLCDKVCH
jgi:hypothetical protein